jgi:ADP-ribose pyrophosphatase YjhB (NUDIX family)
MVHSAGLAVIYKRNKILLVHPKNARWTNSYSIPKGHVELGETSLEAAIRETKEEVGIEFHINTAFGEERELFYIKQKTGKPWKKLSYFVIHIDDLSQVGLSSEILPKEQLQAIEVDWAGFVNFEDAKRRMIPALLKIIEQ